MFRRFLREGYRSPCREIPQGLALLVERHDHRLQLAVVTVERRLQIGGGHALPVALPLLVLLPTPPAARETTKTVQIASDCPFQREGTNTMSGVWKLSPPSSSGNGIFLFVFETLPRSPPKTHAPLAKQNSGQPRSALP